MAPMDCMICTEEMLGHIYLCEGGHSVCGNCMNRRRVQRCPDCLSGISDVRNYQMEQLIKEFKSKQKVLDNLGLIECCFKKFGCDEQMRPDRMQEHEETCPKRKVHCSFVDEGCTTVSSRINIEFHELACSFRKVLCVHGCTEGIPITEVTNHNSSCPNGSYPCRFEKNGCIATMKFCELRDHEVQCEYRTDHCTFSEFGCETFGEQDKIRQHETNCQYQKTSCTFFEAGCNAELCLNERYDHESKCESQILKCPFAKGGCKKVGYADDIREHSVSCKYRTVVCAFQREGCGVVMMYPEIRNHESVCPFRWTNCLFTTNGCTDKVLVDERNAHECKFVPARFRTIRINDAQYRCEDCKRVLSSEVFSVNSKTQAYCQKCSQKYSEIGITRNKTCEDLLRIIRDKFMLPCKYNRNGCEEYIDMGDKNTHETECIVRSVCCTFPNCTWEGTINLLTPHLLSHNAISVMNFINGKFYSSIFTHKIQNLESSNTMLQAAGALFLFTLQKENDLICWIVQLMGKTAVANQYTYTINVMSVGQKLKFVANCESDTEDTNDLIKDGRCVYFKYKTLKNQGFLRDEILKFAIMIRKYN